METNESPTLPIEERLEPEHIPDAESQSEKQPSEETITLCVASYADDGVNATLMDRYGNAAEMPVPPEAFFDGERLPEGDPFDIPLANCPEDMIAAYRKTQAEENVSTSSGPSNAYVIRRETCMAKRPLDETERERVGEQMARALKRKEDLESELDTARKSYNASIKEAEKDAMRAAREWEAGSREYEVLCDVVADYDKEEFVWTETEEPYREVMRRPMTAEEKQFPLPSFYPQVGGQAPEDPLGESPDEARSCISCERYAPGGKTAPELCKQCQQCDEEAPDDFWTPRKACPTCLDASGKVTMPPCSGCRYNADETHRGDADNWRWKDSGCARSETAEDIGEKEGMAC